MAPREYHLASLSDHSTRSVPSSGWCGGDFMLGAGMVIVQDKTNKVVVVQDTKTKEWFLPRGRKDQGESLEQTAMREAYEEVNDVFASRSSSL
jgi:8-oxo-dGTP pyrophosphatase MutT (NUDIX family)